MNTGKITVQEKKAFEAFWRTQRIAIDGKVSPQTMYWFKIYTDPDNIGYQMGQLRPGENGQWDLHDWLTDPEIGCDPNEALLASGLTATEIAERDNREHLENHGVNPDDTNAVNEFERLQQMSSQELDDEIERLEKRLEEITCPECGGDFYGVYHCCETEASFKASQQ